MRKIQQTGRFKTFWNRFCDSSIIFWVVLEYTIWFNVFIQRPILEASLSKFSLNRTLTKTDSNKTWFHTCFSAGNCPLPRWCAEILPGEDRVSPLSLCYLSALWYSHLWGGAPVLTDILVWLHSSWQVCLFVFPSHIPASNVHQRLLTCTSSSAQGSGGANAASTELRQLAPTSREAWWGGIRCSRRSQASWPHFKEWWILL